MSLESVSVENVRCVARAELELHERLNLLWGPNGSGKTSLLESIFLLGRGRSFRTRTTERLIRRSESALTVFGRTLPPNPRTLGLQLVRGAETEARISGVPVESLAQLSEAFPVQVIEPGVHKLLEEGGYRRRRWMDWAVFHVEHPFLDQWSRYSRALRQRNAALRTMVEQARAFDAELARLGESIAASRRASLERLQPFWRTQVQTLAGLEVELTYRRGWPEGASLQEALDATWARDRLRGMTHAGPHRADVQLRLGGAAAREVLSRGQQKLVAMALILAQTQMLRDVFPSPPTLLLDDPGAELDRSRLGTFIGQVSALSCQIVLTALSPELSPFGRPDRVFHVEHGAVALRYNDVSQN